MANERVIVTVYCHRCIEDCRQHILLDVSHLCCVLLNALHNKANMFSIEPHKSASDNFGWFIIACNAYHLSIATHCFDNQFKNAIKHFSFIGILRIENVKLQLLKEIIIILPIFFSPFVLLSAFFERKEGISITKFSIIFISIITLCF